MKTLKFLLFHYPILFLLFAILFAFVILIFAAPFMIPEGILIDLSGSVAVIDNQDQFANLPAIPKAIYLVGDVECHQIATRSYFLNGNEMPFCARDIGIFLGLTAGLLGASYMRISIHLIYLFVGLAPLGLDGGVQLLTSYESTNILRIITGLIAGIAAAFAISTFRHEIVEIRMRKREQRQLADNMKGAMKGSEGIEEQQNELSQR